MIFNAHPRLYWGEYGANPDPAWLEIGSDDGRGYLRVGRARARHDRRARRLDRRRAACSAAPFRAGRRSPRATTSRCAALAPGLRLGASPSACRLSAVVSLVNGHLRRDLLPRPRRVAAARTSGTTSSDHARLRFPTGAAALRYNVLQKLAYLGVLFVLLPLMILTGLTMSPGDGRGLALAARSVRRPADRRARSTSSPPGLLVLFVVVHLAMVVLAGPFNEMRSMITGRYRLPKEKRR